MKKTTQRTPGPQGPGVHLRVAGAGLLGMLAGLAGGVFLARGWPGSAQAPDPSATRAAETELRTGPRAPYASREGSRRQHTTPTRPAGPVTQLAVDPALLVDLTRTEQPRLEERAVLFSDGDPVAAALAMSGDEKAALEREWARVKDRVVRLQRETLRHEQREGQLWLGADPFDGESLRTSFREVALATLGPERGEAFLGVTRSDEAFGGWGRRTSAAYSIEYDRQSDGSLVYRITEKPSPEGPAGKSWISNRIPAHIREVTDFLGLHPEAPNP